MTFYKSQTERNKKQISVCLGWLVTFKGHPNPKALWVWWNYLTFIYEGLYTTICICQNSWSATPRIANSTISKFTIFWNPSMATHPWEGKASFALHQHSKPSVLSRFFSFPDLRQVTLLVCKWPHCVSPFCQSVVLQTCPSPSPLRALCPCVPPHTPAAPIRLDSLQVPKICMPKIFFCLHPLSYEPGEQSLTCLLKFCSNITLLWNFA